MMKFHSKSHVVTIKVEKVMPDGSVQERELKFDCSADNYEFVRVAAGAQRKIEAAMRTNKMDLQSTDGLLQVEREAFDSMAPGQWDATLKFLDGSSVFMAQLVVEMIAAVKNEGISAKAEAVAPAGPDA